jgi:hypothetical protein
VIGGNSSLAIPTIKLLEGLNFSIIATSKLPGYKTEIPEVSTWLTLDVSSLVSIEQFLAEIGDKKFDFILVFVGAPSKDAGSPAAYVETYLTNLISLCHHLVSYLKPKIPTALVHISSRSSLYPSRDILNSAVKGGLNSAIRSMTRDLPQETKLFSVAPGLVLGSTMADDMPVAVRSEHVQRSSGKLLNVDGFAVEFLKLIMRMEEIETGSVIELGAAYS